MPFLENRAEVFQRDAVDVPNGQRVRYLTATRATTPVVEYYQRRATDIGHADGFNIPPQEALALEYANNLNTFFVQTKRGASTKKECQPS